MAEPEPNLRACVVVPARNEEDLVENCLRALANQRLVSPSEYEVILILDDCTDATESRAEAISREAFHLRLHFLYGPGEGAGHARRVGMEAACSRLLSLGQETGLIASTDADTVVAPDWLSVQLGCVERGARAIGGRIELSDDEDLPNGVAGWRAGRGHQRHTDLLSEPAAEAERPGCLEHWQFSGASLALTAEAYREVGGLEPHAALEDEHLERILRQRNVPIQRPLSVSVKTSARLVGRAERGLARDLALASWFRNNTYGANSFDVEGILAQKACQISAVLVADGDDRALRNTAEALLPHKESGLLDEVLVVCSGGPIKALAQEIIVRRAEELMPDFGPVRGYGDVLWRSLSAAKGDILVFVRPGSAGCLPALLGPLVMREELAMVKGFRASSGILSELVARPLINLQRPELAGFIEPLSGDFAVRHGLLETLPFPVGAGVTLSLLLDAARRVGTNALAQADLGQDGLDESTLTPQDLEAAYAIQAAVANRVGGNSGPVPGPLFQPSVGDLKTSRVPLEERPPLSNLDPTAPVGQVVSQQA